MKMFGKNLLSKFSSVSMVVAFEKDGRNGEEPKQMQRDKDITRSGLNRDCLPLINLTRMAKKTNQSILFLMVHVAAWTIFLNCSKNILKL